MLIKPRDQVGLAVEVEQRVAEIKQSIQAQGSHPCLEISQHGAKLPIQLTHHDRKLPLDTAFLPANLLDTAHKGVHAGLLYFCLMHLLQRLAGEHRVEPEQVLDQPEQRANVAGGVLLSEQGAVAGDFPPEPLLGLPAGLLGVTVEQRKNRE
ncbi:MAG: hypothetical protein WCI67_24100 [Chloroflexales bacterium]